VEWVVDVRNRGRRSRKFYTTAAAAEQAAGEIRHAFATSTTPAPLTNRQRAESDLVLAEIREAGCTLQEVWEFWRRANVRPRGTAAIEPNADSTLEQVIMRCVEAKRAENLRDRYVDGLAAYLTSFARGRESTPIQSIGPREIEQWFTARPCAPSTRASNLGRLSALFSFAQRSGLIWSNPCEALARPRLEHQPPKILTPVEAANLLETCGREVPALLAWVALGLLAGLRPEECDQIKWEDVNLGRGHVSVDAAASKVRRRRIVTLEPAAVEWLTAASAVSARLPLPRPSRRNYQRRLREAMRWEEWPHDILRHSAASYLLALHQDAGKVARQLGNSPGILLRSYQELVDRDEAVAFWGIRPGPTAAPVTEAAPAAQP
jgi:integrase